MEIFKANIKPEEINQYLEAGWKVKSFQVVRGSYDDMRIYAVLEKEYKPEPQVKVRVTYPGEK